MSAAVTSLTCHTAIHIVHEKVKFCAACATPITQAKNHTSATFSETNQLVYVLICNWLLSCNIFGL